MRLLWIFHRLTLYLTLTCNLKANTLIFCEASFALLTFSMNHTNIFFYFWLRVFNKRSSFCHRYHILRFFYEIDLEDKRNLAFTKECENTYSTFCWHHINWRLQVSKSATACRFL